MNGEWQPIDTAPRDGTKILAWSKAAEEHIRGGMTVTWWRTNARSHGYIGWGEFNLQHWPPTHWSRLPEPPVAA